ncbi:MAG: transposase [Gammaproteobacteria bacterium]|nr:transposase [Gammaproteobacteria bacterium]
MAKEPWLLVASPRLADWSAKQLVNLYRQRMQIEESFRDMKSQHFGEGLERSRSKGVGRFSVLVLIASLAAFLLWLLGTAAEAAGLHQSLYPSQRKRRVYSRLFLARLLLVLGRCRHELSCLVETITDVDQWVARDHDALFLGGSARG